MENLTKVFKALSDETRLNILILVSNRDICQRGISKILNISDSAVSQHIKVLKESKIITGYKEGYYVIYKLNNEIFDDCIKFISILKKESIGSLEEVIKIDFNNVICNPGCKSTKKCCQRRGE